MVIIEAIPINDAFVDYYGYTKCIFHVQPDTHMILKAFRFIKEGKKQVHFHPKEIKEIDGIWTRIIVHGKTIRNGRIIHQTDFNHNNVRYNEKIDIDEDMFTLESFKKGEINGIDRY